MAFLDVRLPRKVLIVVLSLADHVFELEYAVVEVVITDHSHVDVAHIER